VNEHNATAKDICFGWQNIETKLPNLMRNLYYNEVAKYYNCLSSGVALV